MPCFLKPRAATFEMSASSTGSTRSSASNSWTSAPRRTYALAISVPEAPAPTTASFAGSSSSAQASSVPITRPPNSVPGIGRLTEPVASTIAFDASSSWSPTRHGAGRGQRAEALVHVDAVLLEQHRDAAGERRDDLAAALHDGGEVDLRLADLDAELGRVADLLQDVGRAQHGLGGDARVVQAAPADRSFSTHGRLHAELRGADRGHVAARTGADDDAVVGSGGHAPSLCESRSAAIGAPGRGTFIAAEHADQRPEEPAAEPEHGEAQDDRARCSRRRAATARRRRS